MTVLRSHPALGLLGLLVLSACTLAPGATAPPSSNASQSPTATSSPEASDNPTASPEPSATPEPTASPVSDPNSKVAVVRIEWLGGFVAPQSTMGRYPTVAMYADGRVITEGPQIAIYPGPALPKLQVTHYTQHGIEQVLQWATDAGLTMDDHLIGRLIPDVGMIVFTVTTADGTVHTTSVADMSGDDPAVSAARRFQDVMLNLRSWLADDVASDETPYPYDRLRVISFPANPNNLPDPGLVTTRDWPLGPLDTLGVPLMMEGYRCVVFSGADLDTLRPSIESSNQLTLWQSGDHLFQLILHPLLPDDEDCPSQFMM